MSRSKPYPPLPGKPVAMPPKPGTPAPVAASASITKPNASRPAGKVVHDKRGTAVWDWLAQTGRMAIESTTRLLRKLETPELKIEQTQEQELRIAPDSDSHDAGGGYDPYNQATRPRRSGK